MLKLCGSVVLQKRVFNGMFHVKQWIFAVLNLIMTQKPWILSGKYKFNKNKQMQSGEHHVGGA